MLVVLTGGTGGAKLIQGLSREVDPAELTIICNTADDLILHGLYICPDIDTILYTLAGMSDERKGWGIRGDSFSALEMIERYGGEGWFKLGDRDLATHIERTRLLREGLALSNVTDRLRRALRVRAAIVPMSNERVETRIETGNGELSFQEYFVRERWQPEVKKVFYAGIDKSRPVAGVIDMIRGAAAIILCPSNPVTSIGPILGVPGIRAALKETAAPVVGVSPIIGEQAVSGPAHKLMGVEGWSPSALGLAKAYSDFMDALLIDTEDDGLKSAIEALGIRAVATSIRMISLSDKQRLAREVMALLAK